MYISNCLDECIVHSIGEEDMSRMEFSLPISHSSHLQWYLWTVHSLMLISTTTLLLSSWWAVVAVTIVVVSFIYCTHHYIRHRAIKLERNERGLWQCVFQTKPTCSKLRLISSVVTNQFVLLNFKTPKAKSINVIIMADAVDTELLRQLRLHCRNTKTFQQ